jgi:hypothetical protein
LWAGFSGAGAGAGASAGFSGAGAGAGAGASAGFGASGFGVSAGLQPTVNATNNINDNINAKIFFIKFSPPSLSKYFTNLKKIVYAKTLSTLVNENFIPYISKNQVIFELCKNKNV